MKFFDNFSLAVKTEEIYDDFLMIIEKMKGVGEYARKMSLLMRHQNRWNYKVNLTCQLYHNFFNLKEFCRLPQESERPELVDWQSSKMSSSLSPYHRISLSIFEFYGNRWVIKC